MLSIDLTGKIAVITGATGQLGRVMARTLAGCGADIAVHFHSNADRAASLVRDIQVMGRRVISVQADVGDLASILSMRDIIVAQLGNPAIVVANAVGQYEWTSVLNQDNADYETEFRTCVLQNVNLAKAFIPAMQDAGYGRYIAINTECSMQAFPNQSAYISGKRGMDGVLRVLAKEIGGAGITVNQVAPGWTVSDRDREEGTEVRPEYSNSVPLRRRGTDQEIANTVAFLASDLASFITGVYLPVCGGNVMPCI